MGNSPIDVKGAVHFGVDCWKNAPKKTTNQWWAFVRSWMCSSGVNQLLT